jgi:extradiol dioxygenase family protein
MGGLRLLRPPAHHPTGAHGGEDRPHLQPESHIPSDHWGIVLELADWRKLRDKCRKLGVRFTVEPQVVMKGGPGEQHSLFMEDPDGHPIEFKAFEDPASLFRKA